MCLRGAEQEKCTPASLAWELDLAEAAACTRRVGKGATLAVPCRGAAQFNEAVVQAIVHPERLIPGALAMHVPISDVDGVYATQLSDAVLYYNPSPRDQRVGEVLVPAHGIREQRPSNSPSPPALP